MPSLQCLYTVVKNNLTVPWTFSYLNVTLQPAETLSIFGSLIEAVAARGADRASVNKYLKALHNDLNSGRLVIVSTPAAVLKDETTLNTKMIVLNNGNLQANNPCWV